MNNVSYDPRFEPRSDESAVLTRTVRGSVDMAARSGVVNRTHRVVRQRAQVMQERRSYVRSLMVPLIICSAMLILTVAAVWTGLYQFQATEAAEAMQTDVAALDANNHFLVVLLWFVPVSIALLGAIWFRHSRNSAGNEKVR